MILFKRKLHDYRTQSLFTTLYFHKFHENYMIRENLIHELQYLWWNKCIMSYWNKEGSSWNFKCELSVCYQFVKVSHCEKYPVYGMSVDDKSNTLVYSQKITNGWIYSLLSNKVPQTLNLPYINVEKF